MAITVNTLKSNDLDMSTFGPQRGFAWTPSDANYLEDPSIPNVQVIGRAISLAAAEAITYIDLNGLSHTIPAGFLAAGIIHPIRGFLKIMDTGTTPTSVVVWYG